MITQTDRLRAALRAMLKADRDFLGGDNECVHCGQAQHDEGHAADCVVIQAIEALANWDRCNLDSRTEASVSLWLRDAPMSN